MKWPILIPLAWAAAWAQTDSAIVREGPYWSQTTTGTLSVPPQAGLQLESLGPVVVRGQNGGEFAYSVRKRVRAGSDAEARRLLSQIAVRPRVRGGLVQFVVSSGMARHAMVDVELRVPRTLQRVNLRTSSGSIDAYDLDGEVDTETGGGVVRLDRIGKRVSAASGGGDLSIGTVSGPVRAVSGGGSIRIDKAGGETWIESAGGSIAVTEVHGPLHVSTGGGNINIAGAGSTVSARTAGGLIEVAKAAGNVKCESFAGAIRLRSVSGALNATTASGSIFAELAGNRLMNSVLKTAFGDVTVFIPSNVAVTVRAQNESGNRTTRIVSDFPEIRVQPAVTGIAFAEGEINGGGPILNVSTSNGAIYLRRQK